MSGLAAALTFTLVFLWLNPERFGRWLAKVRSGHDAALAREEQSR